MRQEFVAHKLDDSTIQTVLEHAFGAAELAKSGAVEMAQDAAYMLGMIHDIGKYAEAFQKKIQDGCELHYEHSLGGALVLQDLMFQNPVLATLMMYCVAGHHTGLPDGGLPEDHPDTEGTLCARLNRKPQFIDDWDYSAYQNEIAVSLPEAKKLYKELETAYKISKEEFTERFAFFTRYLFSCLTDADFLDTEHFYRPDTKRTLRSDFKDADNRLQNKMHQFKNTTELQKARGRLQAQAFQNSRKVTGISSLQMPVGSGKTLCSFEIALQKALAMGKKRIIYVIPYTSIIEQTADLFTGLVGETTNVLQHHSNYAFEESSGTDSDTMKKLRLASENWDAPIIVTTNVQFFESMYHYRGSRLRKLHNLADSVIVFDEIHMLPVEMLQPCFRALHYAVKYLNSEVLLLSATMPDYTMVTQTLFPDMQIHQLITDFSDFKYFKKCQYHNLNTVEDDALLLKAAEYESSLIIVNKRDTARRLYEKMSGNKYHLSTYMTPYDRSLTIQKIREDLANSVQVTVVSTSLIEAGVDVDFKAVFREMTGLDSILQSTGRCNREGKSEYGDVFLFKTNERQAPGNQVKTEITEKLLKEYEDIESPECIRTYYQKLFERSFADIEAYNIASLPETHLSRFISIPFTTYANQFRMIQDNTTGVVINLYPDTKDLIRRYHQFDSTARRKLQQYTIALREKELKDAVDQGIIHQEEELYVLDNSIFYSHETGILLNGTATLMF